MHPRSRRMVALCLALALSAAVAGAQSLAVDTPQPYVSQVVRGSGLPPGEGFLLLLGGTPIGAGQTDGSGAFTYNFNVTTAPPVVPRPVALAFYGGGRFEGTENETPYPRTVGLSPSGTVVLEEPASQGQVLVSGSGLPPGCRFELSAVIDGFFSDRFSLGASEVQPDGSFGPYNFGFPARPASVSDFLLDCTGGGGATFLQGKSPSTYPATIPLAPFDPGSVEPTMTIRTPVPFRDQVVRGAGLPPNGTFSLVVSGQATGWGGTDPAGGFAFNFDVSSVPPDLPRPVVLDFGGSQVFSGIEHAGDYPHAVALSPSGSLSIEAPREGATALIAGAGFPSCDSSQLFAVTGDARTPLGAFNVTPTGLWSFGFSFPPEAPNASSYLWQGEATCAGKSLEGPNPGGKYPRHVRLSPPGGRVLYVDRAGACAGRSPCFTGIQAAIDAAARGDGVLVGPGVYAENVRFHGKAILVAAEEGPLATAIDGRRAGPAVTFADGEDLSSVLLGFTVANGFTDGIGGGVRVDGASPLILANLVARNAYGNGGGGIGVSSGSPAVVWNWVFQNRQSGSGGIGGGGIAVAGASRAALVSNVIYGNTAPSGAGISLFAAGNPVVYGNVISGNAASSEGGGISMGNTSDADIVQNLIVYNSAPQGGGIAALVPLGARGPLLVGNTIADNDGPQGSGAFLGGFDDQTTLVNNVIVGRAGQPAVFCGSFSPSTPVFRHNDVFRPGGPAYAGDCTDPSGEDGNISADPRFTDPARANYTLLAGSPAIDAGDNAAPFLPPTDLAGEARVVGAAVDMGAYERQIAAAGPVSARLRSASEAARSIDQARAAYARFLRLKEKARPGAR